MSQQNIIASTRRSGEAPLSRLDAKEKIRAIGKGSVIMFTRLLDITPGFYESRVAPVIRQALRQLDTDPLVGVVGEDELFEDDKKRSKLLCSIGDCPRFWHYGADEMIRRTAHIRYKIRNEQPELFGPWDRLESIKVNDEFIDIYLPNYWELERILEAMLKTERRKLLDHPNLRTTGGDLSTTARYAVPSAASQAGASPSRRAGRVTKVSKKLARSMLAVPVPNGDADDYRMYPFTEFCSDTLLKDWQEAGGKGDLSPEWFSFTKLKNVIYPSIFDNGYLRLKVDPPREDCPDYICLNGINDDFGDNNEKFQAMIEQFKYGAQMLGTESFILEYVQTEK